MIKKLVSVVLLFILCISAASCTKPVLPEPTEPTTPAAEYTDGKWTMVKTGSSVTAANYFVTENGAKADGGTDDSGAINETLKKAGSAGGGVVYMPAGTYCLNSPLSVPENVTLCGDFVSPASRKTPGEGTLLLANKTEQTMSRPLIDLGNNSSVCGVSVFYPDQTGTSFIKYPATVSQTSGKSASVKDLAVLNGWDGLVFDSPECETLTVENVYLTVLHSGISATRYSVKATLRNISVTPSYWINYGMTAEEADMLRVYLRSGLTAVRLSGTGNAFVRSVTTDMANCGLLIEQPYSSTGKILVSSSLFANSAHALDIKECSVSGIAFAGCVFKGLSESGTSGVYMDKNFLSSAVFTECTFEGKSESCVESAGRGRLSFTGCRFDGWRQQAIKSNDIAFSVTNCSFGSMGTVQQSGANTVSLYTLDFLRDMPENANGLTYIKTAENDYSYNFPGKILSEVSYPGTPGRIFYLQDYTEDELHGDITYLLRDALADAEKAGGGIIFIPPGTYKIANGITVGPNIRIQGSGADMKNPLSTVIQTSLSPSGNTNVFTLSDNSGLCDIAIRFTVEPPSATSNPDLSSYSSAAVAGISASGIYLNNVRTSGAATGFYFTDCTDINLKNIGGSALVTGIKIENCNDADLQDITFNDSYSSENVSVLQQTRFRAVAVSGGSEIRIENLDHTNGDYTIRLESDSVPVVPDEYSLVICGVFSEKVYAAVSVDRYDSAAIVNVASAPEIFSQNAYHLHSLSTNTGRILLVNLIGSGTVSGAWNIRNGSVFIIGNIISSAGSTMLRTANGNVRVIGSMFLDNSCSYHVEADTGLVFLTGNLINSTATFDGLNKTYLRRYIRSEATYADELNLKQAD